MDKETLSNYGWIVICVLVLAVMIALATPFGSFISEAIQSTTKGLFDVNKSALDSTGLINIDNQEFDVPDMNHGAENGGNAGETPVTPETPENPETPVVYELSGTWRFNTSITLPTEEYSLDINFTNATGSKFDEFYVSSYQICYRFGRDPSIKIYVRGEWDLDSMKTLSFGTTGQEVPQGFYEWFTTNASKVDTNQSETPTLISFTIDGTSYQAEEGMTWESWIASHYNNGNVIQNGTYVEGNGGGSQNAIHLEGSIICQQKTDVIIANATYTTNQNTGQGGGGAD